MRRPFEGGQEFEGPLHRDRSLYGCCEIPHEKSIAAGTG